MFTFIGVLLLILSTVSYVWDKKTKEDEEKNEKNELYNSKVVEKGHPSSFFKPIKKIIPFPIPLPVHRAYLVIAGIGILALNGLFFWANAGTAYAVQYPWGGDKMVTTQGLKIKMWGRTIPISYEISIQDKIVYEGEELENNDGIYNRVARKWEFSDAIKAEIATAIIIEIDVLDEEVFLSMADKNRSERKLIVGRVMPNIDAALKNTCKLMDAQEYISGKASDFDRYFRDQLENGMYQVEEYYEQDEVAPEVIGNTNTVRTLNPKKSSRQKRFRIKRDSLGEIVRDNNSNTLKQYGIKIAQAQVTSIDWEESFDKRLDLQKNEVAKTQLEKQEAERQYYTAKKEIAKGEAEKAAERAALEKEQIKLTIAAETQAKVAEQNVIVEKRQLEVEKFKAQSKKVAADALYYENMKRVKAGLTPQERLAGDIQMNRDKYEFISKWDLPSVYIEGGAGGKGGDGLLTSLIGADIAKNMRTSRK